MSDLISRCELFNRLATVQTLGEAYGVIQEMPTVDAVPVVRCKDCKWFNDLGCAIRIVDESDKPKETDFCSFGERKDGNGNELE